jgi:hypothetical protein
MGKKMAGSRLVHSTPLNHIAAMAAAVVLTLAALPCVAAEIELKAVLRPRGHEALEHAFW